MTIIEYVNANFNGNQAAFARHMSVDAQTVRKWIRADWIVVDGALYSPRREIPALQSS